MVSLLSLCFLSLAADVPGKLSPGEQPLPSIAEHGKMKFDKTAEANANTAAGQAVDPQASIPHAKIYGSPDGQL